MLMSLIDYLCKKRIEIPNYYAFAEIITEALKEFERKLLSSIEENINQKQKYLLDELLEADEEYLSEEKQELKIKRYKIQ
jgi:hypothetical protein